MEKHIRQNVDRVSSKRKKCMLSSTVQSQHNADMKKFVLLGREKLTNKNNLSIMRKKYEKKKKRERLVSISQQQLEFTVIWAH